MADITIRTNLGTLVIVAMTSDWEYIFYMDDVEEMPYYRIEVKPIYQKQDFPILFNLNKSTFDAIIKNAIEMCNEILKSPTYEEHEEDDRCLVDKMTDFRDLLIETQTNGDGQWMQ